MQNASGAPAVVRRRISAAGTPAAHSDSVSAPDDVPQPAATGTRSSSSAARNPQCAANARNPLDNTTSTRPPPVAS